MTGSDRWQAISALYADALALPEPQRGRNGVALRETVAILSRIQIVEA